MAIDVKKATEGKNMKMTEADIDAFFESDTFKEMMEGWETLNKAIDEKKATLKVEDVMGYAHTALAEGVAVIGDREDDLLTSALQDFVAEMVCSFFELDQLYTHDGFRSTVNIPFEQFIDKEKRFGDELMFVDWFVPLEAEGQTLILKAISGQGESIYVFETLSNAHSYEDCEKAWEPINKTYPISDVIN